MGLYRDLEGIDAYANHAPWGCGLCFLQMCMVPPQHASFYQGAGETSAGPSGSPEQDLGEIIRGNSSTGQHLEQRHQEDRVCSWDQILFIRVCSLIMLYMGWINQGSNYVLCNLVVATKA